MALFVIDNILKKEFNLAFSAFSNRYIKRVKKINFINILDHKPSNSIVYLVINNKILSLNKYLKF